MYPGITVDALHQGAGPAPVVGLYGEALGVDWSSGWPEVDGLANVVVTLEGGRREVRNERHPAVVSIVARAAAPCCFYSSPAGWCPAGVGVRAWTPRPALVQNRGAGKKPRGCVGIDVE